MLSRRQLRMKAIQALYAFFQSKNERLDLGEKEMFTSLDKLYELFIYMISVLLELSDFASKRIEENKQKFLPTQDDLNPNLRFISNKVLLKIADNKDFRKYRDRYKINWSQDEEMFRKLLNQIKDNQDFKGYMDGESESFNADRDILVKIIKRILVNSELLEFYFEEKSIYWADDFHMASLLLVKFIKSIDEKWDENNKLPVLFPKDEDGNTDEDKLFIRDLFRKTIIKSDDFIKLIEDKVKNWEIERIAVMDILLIKMALVELTEFQSIPVKVTLNEYIELAKMYSTPKSKVFVNGILDKLIGDLKEQKLIVKAGRGLLDN